MASMQGPDNPTGTILIVDDQASTARLVGRWLEADGHKVILAETGKAALEVAPAQQPDLILLDIMIPVPSGFEVCQRLKRDAATRHIPVLLMSGLQDPANAKRAVEVGAADFLAKPLQRDDVCARVRQHLAQSKKS